MLARFYTKNKIDGQTLFWAGAMLVAERLRNRIDVLENSPARSVGPVTVSIGAAQCRPGETIAETFASADGALYKAKQSGPNGVEW